MSKEEMVEVHDSEGNVTGVITREEADKGGQIIKNVIVFLFNSTGNVWVQLRPQSKGHFPGMWDVSACGAVNTDDEDELQAAVRETHEETGGLKLELKFIKTFMNVFVGHDGQETKRLSSVYIGVTDEIPQPNEEVDEFKSWKPEELRKHAEENSKLYVPSFVVELDIAAAGHRNLGYN